MMGMNIAGVFEFQTTGRVTNSVGAELPPIGVFPNLILNACYNLLRSTPIQDMVFGLKIGTGNTAPVATDVILASDSNKTVTKITAGTLAVDGGDPTTLVYTVVFEYVHGDVAALAIREFGVTSYDTQLICRSLVKDGSNNPITITLTQGDKLTVTYQFRITMAPQDTQYTHTTDYTGAGSSSFTSVIRLSTKPWQVFHPTMVLFPKLAGMTDAMARSLTGTSGPERATLGKILYDVQSKTYDTGSGYADGLMNFHGSLINAADNNIYTVETNVYSSYVLGGPNGAIRDASISFNMDYHADAVEQISTFVLGFQQGFDRIFCPLGVITFSVPYPKIPGQAKTINSILRVTYT